MDNILREKLDRSTVDILRKDVTGHDEDHSAIVYNFAIKIAVGEGWLEHINENTLYAIAKLHDTGYSNPEGAKDHYVSHPQYGVEIAKKILPEVGFPEADMPIVLEGILLHDDLKPWAIANRKPTNVKEILLVQDADNLEGMGARGIARILDYCLRVGRPLYNKNLPVNKETLLEDCEKSAIHNILLHAITLGENLNTETAKQMARPKQGVMIDYVEQYMQETAEAIQT
jgi:uncharacterized protein